MNIEELQEQFEIYKEIVTDQIKQINDNEWQITIEDENNPNNCLYLIFKEIHNNSHQIIHYESSMELPPFSDFYNFELFNQINQYLFQHFLDDDESPFYSLHLSIQEAFYEWNVKQTETKQSLYEQFEQFDEIPTIDTTEQMKTTTNYIECFTLWKDYHYHTIRISTIRNRFENLEKFFDCAKIGKHRHITSYSTIRYYNDEIWLMNRRNGNPLFDVIFNIDDISRPLSQLLKALHYLYSRGMFHGHLTKNCIIYTSSSNVTLTNWIILYLLEGNYYPESQSALLKILKKDLETIAKYIEENVYERNSSFQLTTFVETLKNYDSLDLIPLIKMAQQLPSNQSQMNTFELRGEYQESTELSEMIGFTAYYRNQDNQYYCFQEIDLTTLSQTIIPEVKTKLYKFCQIQNKYFQYYFFSQPVLMIRMSITETPLNWYLQQKSLFKDKMRTRKLFMKIVSAISYLHNQNIGHGALSLKHIFIKNNDIKLAFFNLITPTSTVMQNDVIQLQKLWIVFGYCYFNETLKMDQLQSNEFVKNLRIEFPEINAIKKAQNIEEIMSIVQKYDNKSRKILSQLLQNEYLMILNEYFNQQQQICKKDREHSVFLTTLDESFSNNSVLLPSDIIKEVTIENKTKDLQSNVYLSQNGKFYQFELSPHLVELQRYQQERLLNYSLYHQDNKIGIEMIHGNVNMKTFSDTIISLLFTSRPILNMTNGNSHSLHYNFPVYLILLAEAFNVPIDKDESYKQLYNELEKKTITNPLLKKILTTNETKVLLELMETHPFLQTLKEMIEQKDIRSLLRNDESYLCFNVVCTECQSIATCKHSFICKIRNLNDNSIVGYIHTYDSVFENENNCLNNSSSRNTLYLGNSNIQNQNEIVDIPFGSSPQTSSIVSIKHCKSSNSSNSSSLKSSFEDHTFYKKLTSNSVQKEIQTLASISSSNISNNYNNNNLTNHNNSTISLSKSSVSTVTNSTLSMKLSNSISISHSNQNNSKEQNNSASTPLSGEMYMKSGLHLSIDRNRESQQEVLNSILNSKGFICNLFIHPIQPTIEIEQKSKIIVISSIKSSQSLLLARKLRERNQIVETFFRKEMTMKQAWKMGKQLNCSQLIFFNGLFHLLSDDILNNSSFDLNNFNNSNNFNKEMKNNFTEKEKYTSFQFTSVDEIIQHLFPSHSVQFEFVSFNATSLSNFQVQNESSNSLCISQKEKTQQYISALVILFTNEIVFNKRKEEIEKIKNEYVQEFQEIDLMILLKQFDLEDIQILKKKDGIFTVV